MDEKLAYTPTTTQRKRNNDHFKTTGISISLSEFSKSGFNSTLGANLNNFSPDTADKFAFNRII